MTENEAKQLFEKYRQGTCTENERQLMEEFFQSYQKHPSWLNWKHGDKIEIGNSLYSKVNANISSYERTKKSKVRSLWKPVLKYAAVVVFLLATIFTINHYANQEQPEITTITKTTLRGQKSNLVLSDGTTIRLNAESTISFPEKFNGNTREISLIGEAFFEVTKNPKQPFIVRSGKLTTTVLGTSFNINAFPDKEIAVTVATGKVRVAPSEEMFSPGGSLSLPSIGSAQKVEGITLTPNEQATYNPTTGSLETNTVVLERYLAWKNNIIYLDNTPLKEVTEMLERWYNIEIQLENEGMNNCLLTGKYKGDQMINILNSLKFMKGIDYRFTNEKQLVLIGDPCDGSGQTGNK